MVWMWAWPIHAWTWTSEALLTAIEPKKWRNEWNGSVRSPARRVASPQGAWVEVAAEGGGEDGVLVAGLQLAAGEARELVGDLVDHGDDADLAGLRGDDLAVGEVAAHADGLAGEVDVAPAQREQLAAPQTGQSGGEDDGGVLVVGGATDDGVDLLTRTHVVVAGVADGVALDAVDRVGGDELAALRVPHDRAEDQSAPGRRSACAHSRRASARSPGG